MVKRRLLLLPALVAGALVVTSQPAAADTVDRTSQPNHDISITVSSGADSDRDGDGNFNTATKGDRVVVFIAVFNNADAAQTVHVDMRFDGPGTAQDDAFTADFDLAADGGNRQGIVEAFMVKKDTPKGTYTSTLTASGTEEVSGTSTFTVH